MATTEKWQGELTNNCGCEVDCFGDCWENSLCMLEDDLGKWFTDNADKWWQVDGLPLWNRDIVGVFHADTIVEFVRGITVNSEWKLRYRLDGDYLVLRLSHHDVPMGRQFTVSYGVDDEWIDAQSGYKRLRSLQ